ncbi:MAG: S9 family peptidase [Bacteroidetes bacterium]|nr:MAG: S9 family peptidase [Bacteroidota bacterium]
MKLQDTTLFCATFLIMITTFFPTVHAQEDLGYQMPAKAIADLIDAPPTPDVRLSPNNKWMLILYQPGLPSIEEVAQAELRLAGLRINPETNGPSRSGTFNDLKITEVGTGEMRSVAGLPEPAHIENVLWSPDGEKVAFTHTRRDGIELWILDVATATARKLTDDPINDAMGRTPFVWFAGGQKLMYKAIVAGRGAPPQPSRVPAGPVIQSNDGEVAAVRTYQDLLRNKYDEDLFEYYTTAQLKVFDLKSNTSHPFGKPAMISGFSVSPDSRFVMISQIEKPFSYIVPYGRFPFTQTIYDAGGRMVRELARVPAAENIPKGFGATRLGGRSFGWRADHPAAVYWVEALDGGDPRSDVRFRERMFYVEAPFEGPPKRGIDLELRYGGVMWGTDGLAMVSEWWWPNRRQVTSRWKPADPEAGKTTLFDRSWEDRYDAPGVFERTLNAFGRSVLLTADDGQTLFLRGEGASPEGNRPFVDRFDLKTGKRTRLWRSEAPYYEVPISILSVEAGTVLTRRESNYEPPNYFIRHLKTGELRQITDFPNPFEALKSVKKEFIKYKRKDGVELTGTLYTPPGYDKEKDGPLPVLMWAYPREFKSKAAASQVSDSPYAFIRVGWWSPILWTMEGYAVFDDFGMPIVGEGDQEPNETFIEQLTAGAEAAVQTLVERGVADPERIAVGGHSYGAFMTANLMAHTDLFAAGIARSGAYNRTLTPFGFQSEERTFWEAPETYFKMSPFMHADKIKEPLLLIHGEADNNSGTFPMQSERFYAALKGHGGTVRLVMLPHESHGYRARESVMHVAWETGRWLDKYVKNKPPKKKP